MTKINIIPTTPEHIRILGEHLRDDDRREVLAFGFPVKKVLWRTYKAAIFSKTAFVNGELAAVWGVGGSYLGMSVRPWLLTTPACEKISPLRFARIYQQEVMSMLGSYPLLVNWVDARYTKAVRLLENIGFDVFDPEEFGPWKEMFRRFEMRRQ